MGLEHADGIAKMREGDQGMVLGLADGIAKMREGLADHEMFDSERCGRLWMARLFLLSHKGNHKKGHRSELQQNFTVHVVPSVGWTRCVPL